MSEAARSCPTLCDPMDSSPPHPSVHGDPERSSTSVPVLFPVQTPPRNTGLLNGGRGGPLPLAASPSLFVKPLVDFTSAPFPTCRQTESLYLHPKILVSVVPCSLGSCVHCLCLGELRGRGLMLGWTESVREEHSKDCTPRRQPSQWHFFWPHSQPGV